MYQLKLLDDPKRDYWKLMTVATVGAFLGLFFATPLRKFFVIKAARELRLLFPSSSATAITIRSMHLAADRGSSSAQTQMKVLIVAFVAAFFLRVLSPFAVGILWVSLAPTTGLDNDIFNICRTGIYGRGRTSGLVILGPFWCWKIGGGL